MQLPSMIFASFLAGGAYAFQFQAYSDNNYHGRVKNYVRKQDVAFTLYGAT